MSDKAPFLVTLILTIIGWAITHVVTELTTAPTLELQSEVRRAASGQVLELRLTNLTRDKVFKGLSLLVTVSDGETLNRFTVTPVEPAHEGDDPAHSAGLSGSFVFPEIQPGSIFYAEAEYIGSTPPHVRIQMPEGTVRIVEPSLETFIIRNELGLLFGLMIIGMGFLSILLLVGVLRVCRLGAKPLDTFRTERDW